MAPPRSRGRLLGSALLAAGLLATALPTAASAYRGPGSFYPVQQPPVYPGTQTPVESWRLVGTGGYKDSAGQDQFGASQVQISSHFVLGSEHQRTGDGGWFIAPSDTGVANDGVDIDFTFRPNQSVILPDRDTATGGGNFADDGLADFRLAHLKYGLPAPAGGFPKLLRDWVGPDLASVLPGYVFWAGKGLSTERPEQPHVGWTTLNGRQPEGVGRVDLADGDSGSTGFWYPAPGRTPIISGIISTWNGGVLTYGDTIRYASRLAPGGSNYATVADFFDAQFAKYPASQRPTWTTLAAEGIDLTKLRPPAPRNIRVTAGTPTSLTIGWDHPNENRVPRDNYIVTVSPGNITRTIVGDQNSVQLDGLTTGTAYTVKVIARNANGDSPASTKRSGMPNEVDRPSVPDAELLEPQSITATPHADPTAVADMTATAAMATRTVGSQTELDYCATVQWTMPANGETVVNFGGDDVAQKPADQSVRVGRFGDTPATYSVTDGRASFRMCGLTPNQLYGIVAWNTWAPNPQGPTLLRTVRPPAGPALGTVLGAATNVRVRTYRAITNDRVDYCMRASWTAPTTVTGLALRYVVDGAGDVSFGPTAPLSATEFVRCGFPAEQPVVFTVKTYHGDLQSGSKTVWTDAVTNAPLVTPAGAPLGTAVPKPTNLSLTTAPANNAGTVDYCITATWQLADLAGFTRIDTAGAWNADASSTAEAEVTASGTSRTSKLCGLQPGTAYTVSAGVIYTNGSFVPYEATATITTPSGAAPGTEWEAPNNLRVTQQLVNGQRCATLMWAAPAPVDGFPVLKYNAYLVSDDGTYSAIAYSLSALQGTKQFCGLPASKAITATVQAVYRSSITAETSLPFTSAA